MLCNSYKILRLRAAIHDDVLMHIARSQARQDRLRPAADIDEDISFDVQSRQPLLELFSVITHFFIPIFLRILGINKAITNANGTKNINGQNKIAKTKNSPAKPIALKRVFIISSPPLK